MQSAKQKQSIRVSPLLVEAACKPCEEVLQTLGTTQSGLAQAEAEERSLKHGPNEVSQEKHHGWLARLWTAVRNPLVILLSLLAVVSALTGDLRAATVMALMVVLGVSLRFVQEAKADAAAARVGAMTRVTATGLRDGQAGE